MTWEEDFIAALDELRDEEGRLPMWLAKALADFVRDADAEAADALIAMGRGA